MLLKVEMIMIEIGDVGLGTEGWRTHKQNSFVSVIAICYQIIILLKIRLLDLYFMLFVFYCCIFCNYLLSFFYVYLFIIDCTFTQQKKQKRNNFLFCQLFKF